MSLPTPSPEDPAWAAETRLTPRPPPVPIRQVLIVSAHRAPAATAEPGRRWRGFPGGRVVASATLVVVAVTLLEAATTQAIGRWAGATLVLASTFGALVTRSGDRCLPAMMPPLAFLAALLVAGQLLLPTGSSLVEREVLLIIGALGANAAWVVGATAAAVLVAAVGHLLDRRAR